MTVMKRTLLVLATLMLCMTVNGAQEKDPETDHVRVTLTDGRIVEGYIQKYWIDGKLFKRMNTSFTMSPTADGKNTVKYDADDVVSIDFVRKVSIDGRYDHLESHLVANPSTLKPKSIRRQLIYKEGTTDVGTVYWWNGVDSQNMQLGRLNVSTIYGVCLAGDSVVVPFMTGNVISLNAMRIHYKKTRSGFVDYVDRCVLKGGKNLWRTIAADPMLFLEICSGYDKTKERK